MVERIRNSGRGKAQKRKSGKAGGLAIPPGNRSATGASRIRVSITHGDLGYTRHAVAVGHYQGDSIVGAERYLDKRLQLRLSGHKAMEQYPGKLGTSAVFLNPDPYAKPGGAIIVGLGPVGKLSPAELASSFASALSEYVLTIAESSDDRFGISRGDQRSVQITSLLIGTGAGGISVEESVFAILKGTRKVAALLRDKRPTEKKNVNVSIDELEFVELWQDAAIQAARAVAQVKHIPELRGFFDCDEHVRESTGGQRRLIRDQDPEWWHRLQILCDENGDLRFNAITGLARTEVSLLAMQRTVLDKFIEQAIADCSNDRETARTLFELLLPNRLKEQAPDRLKTVLLLDCESARYPWELLEDRFEGPGRPPSVESGLVRQLETEQFRERVNPTGDNSIFVVGDPVTNFTALPGAAAEARLVANLFAERGFSVARQINADALPIITSLHARAYRVLHLAGHGVHEEVFNNIQKTAAGPGAPSPADEKPAMISGMIIGENIFLTPADVEQMRHVPELVFINCCFLGRTDKTKQDTFRKDRHKLAANVAAQFIRMGVSAVVAAGWAVDDDAASTFAREFYTAMLDGKPFGESVREAREKTYTEHRSVNTWGAYQCYGDPDYRLIASKQGRQVIFADKTYVASSEMVVDIANLTGRAQTAREEHLQTFPAELDRIIKRGEPSWLFKAEVASALGLAYGEIGDFQKAIDYLDRALAANKADMTVRAVEQRANFKVRWAASLDQGGGKESRRFKPAEMISEAIRELESLKSLASTPERLSLLGGAHKRLASVQAPGNRKKALESMAACYKEAHELAYIGGRGRIDPYPLLNWLAAEILKELYGAAGGGSISKKIAADTDKWCGLARTAADKKDRDEPDFWNSLAVSEADLVCGLAHGGLDRMAESIFAGYQRAKERGASPREFRSVTEHLAFLIRMIAEAPEKRPVQKELNALRQLQDKLATLAG